MRGRRGYHARRIAETAGHAERVMPPVEELPPPGETARELPADEALAAMYAALTDKVMQRIYRDRPVK